MSSAQRSFVQKLSKQNAAEVRRQAISSRESSWSSCSTILSGCITSLSLSDVVEPVDFEEFILQHKDIIECDPLRHVFQFPSNDIEVDVVPPSIRTETPIVPEEPPEEWSCQVKDSVRWLTRDFVVVNYNYRCHSTSWSQPNSFEEREELAKKLPRQEFEIDSEITNLESNCNGKSGWDTYSEGGSIASDGRRSSWASLDLRHSESDRLDLNLLDRIPPDRVDQLNAIRRLENRQNAFFLLYPAQEEEDMIERRLRGTMPTEHLGHRLLVKCLQLRLELDVEPIFLTLALYDAKEKKKISENFYTDLNSEEIKHMLSTHIEYSDISTRSRACIFNVTHPSTELFLVIKLEKILQGDIGECAEPYMKEEKNKDKIKFNAVAACERLGRYRMPLAWTAISLMNLVNNEASFEREDQTTSSSNSLDRKSNNSSLDGFKKRTNMSLTGRGSLDRYSSGEKRRSWSPEDFVSGLDNFRPLTITISSFFRQESERLKDEDLYKFLQDLKRPCYLMKKLKVIPGMLKLEISPCPDDLKYVLTPELAKIVPYPDQKGRPIKEILEFPAREIFVPHDTYRNMIYVYPRELNFTNRGIRDLGSARNLVVKIELKSGESVALESIFGKSSCPEFAKEAYTSVSYHNKCPSFYDEIKIKLPSKLGPHHHLFFTLYHISCKKKPENPAVETPVGYTWIPLLSDGRLQSGELNLPVMMEPPPSNYCYIPPGVLLPGTRWLDNHRGVFSVNIEAASSVHPQDKYLDRFLNLCASLEEGNLPPLYGETNMETELKKSIADLCNAKMEPLVRFLPLVFDKLLTLLIRPPVVDRIPLNLGQALLESIANLVQNITLHAVGNKDEHNRHSLLATYIEYQCSVPALCTPNNGSPSARMQRSSSDSDLKVELDGGMLSRGLDRTASMRTGREEDNEMLQAPRSSLHEEIALQWVVSSVPARDLAMANSWFFLELMIKSMTETLWRVEGLDAPRQLRFSEQFCDDVTTLVQTITAEIISKHNKDPKASQSLNTSVAFFLFDLFSIMDRGLVLSLIRTYYKQMTAKTASLPDAHAHALIGYKLDFLRIVLSHEHLIPLNLPIPVSVSGRSSPSPSVVSSTSQTSLVSTIAATDKLQTSELTPQFRSQHYLIGLLLTELSAVLECQNPLLHKKVVNTVRNLMTSHDRDSRYTDPACKARVAALYMPLLGIVLRALPLLHKSSVDMVKTTSEEPEPIQTKVAAVISGSIPAPALDEFIPSPQPVLRNKGLNSETTRHLLSCFLWLLKNLDRDLLRNWCIESSVTRLRQLLDVFNICLYCFEYSGKKQIKRRNQKKFGKNIDIKAKLEDVILGQGSARSEMMMRRKERNPPSPGWAAGDASSNQGQSERLRWRKEQKVYKPLTEGGVCPRQQAETDAYIEGNLATEATLIILDTLEMIVHVATMSMSFQGQGLLGYVLGVILRALSCNQSNEALHNLFGTQRAIVFKFPNLLFDEETEHCADLCLQLLTHCSSLMSPVRAHAAASLYLLMRQNFEIGNNFARVKMQVTMSLSSLVGTSQSYSEEALRRALKNILVFAEEDNELQDTTFPEQVRDLVFNLHMILSDMVKMKEFQEDPEMLLDLMYRIAKGYQNSPDLRLTWLANMAQKHMEHNNHTEAAMCLVHSAALVAEYLHMLEDRLHLPVGAVSFEKITPNALEESAVSDDVLSPDEEGVCLGNYFTESGLVGLLEHAANSFHTAGMYEAMNDVYKILIPIAEEARDYKKLANIHGKLQEAFTRIEQLQGKRVFGTYFRVGFYGSKFGDLDGEEFIYKEPTLTKLPEIFNRLENFYGERFGMDNMVIIKDSNIVDPKSLDPDKGYIQITYVEPYFDTFEVPRHRATYFHKNFNIKRFVYYTPFTVSGKAHGELHEQCKRRTVLTTANHFPYIKTRIQVVDRRQSVVTPIEGAIEDLQKKTAELASATSQEPPDPKILQMVLQGCIGTTVNQGPMEVALVFLSDLQDGRAPNRLQTKLRLCFKDFSKKCSDALRKNKNLIGPDQRDYQKELERNYHKFVDRLTPLLGCPV